jgi:hypothetical protein
MAVVALTVGIGGGTRAAGDPAPGGPCGNGGVGWLRELQGPRLELHGLAAAGDGGVVLAATFQDQLRLRDGERVIDEVAGRKATASVLIKVAANGAPAWHRVLAGVDGISAMTAATDGAIVVAGSFRRQAALEGAPGRPPLPFPGDVAQPRFFLGVYAPDGTPRRVNILGDMPGRAGDSQPQAAIERLVPVGGDVALAGSFSEQITFGTDAHRTTLVARGGRDTFVARVRADGSLVWAARVGGGGYDFPRALTALADGSIVVAGTFTEKGVGNPPAATPPGATFGDGDAPVVHAQGPSDAFVARFSPEGRALWARAVGGDEPVKSKPLPGTTFVWPHPEAIHALLPSTDGGVLMAGTAPLPMHIGADEVAFAAGGKTRVLSDSFMARLTGAGGLVQAIELGGDLLAADALPGGDIIVVGAVAGENPYPSVGKRRVTLSTVGRDDVLIARHAPDGALRWATRLGGFGGDRAFAVAADRSGAATVAASFDRDFAVGDGCRPVRVARQQGPGSAKSVFLLRIDAGAAPSDEARARRVADRRGKVRAARAAAQRAFKARRYADACPLYEQVAALAPDDAPAQADLALCLQRLGRDADAIAANYKAIALGARTDLDDAGDGRTRGHAYYNLTKLGVVVKLPDKKCGPLPAAPGCGQTLWACTLPPGRSYGTGGGTTWTTLRVGVTRDDAEVGEDEDQSPPGLAGGGSDDGNSDKGGNVWASGFASAERPASVDIGLDEESESFCHEDAGDDCGKSDGRVECALVTADACLGLVSVACTDNRDGKDARPSIDEYHLAPAPP